MAEFLSKRNKGAPSTGNELGSELRIKEAFPELFRKANPAIDPKTEMLSALSLLKFHEIDALPLSFDAEKKNRALTGFSSLARLMQLDQKNLSRFLRQPCQNASEPFAKVSANRTVSVLLDKFLRTRFGFARVDDGKNVGTMVGLGDVLELYKVGAFKTVLTVDDVASPIFSMTPETTARRALKAMFDRGVRRVFVDGSKGFVSERSMIERLFSPRVLAAAAENPSEDLMGTPLSDFEIAEAEEVKQGTKLREAAGLLKQKRGKCLVVEEKVVTPWDVVMKPWKAKALKIG